MQAYSNDSTVIDWRHPDVVALAATLAVERLAYRGEADLVIDLPEIRPEPLEAVLIVLRRATTLQDVMDHLPDVDVIRTPLSW